MNRKDSDAFMRKTKRAIVALLTVLFCVSVFLLVAVQYGLYDFLLPFTPQEIHRVSAISANTQWDYMDDGFEPGIGNVWTTAQYDSSFWNKSSGVFAATVQEQPVIALRTQATNGTGSPTCFFRTTFNVQNADSFHAIQGEIHYSDAVVVYLNGTIIFAGNVPAGGYQSNQESRVAEVLEETQQLQFLVTDMSSLREGENILSVELHQDTADSTGAYFFFESLELQTSEFKQQFPNTQHLMLQMGKNESEVQVSWVTPMADYYQVEYSEAASLQNEEGASFVATNAVILGRSSIPGTALYHHTATLSRLKTDAQYVYRIVRIGGNQGSKLLRLQTQQRANFSFMLLGDAQLGAYGADDSALWIASVKAAAQTLGKVDFILSAGDQVDGTGTVEAVMQSYLDFRAPDLFKQTPVLTITGNHEAADDTARLYQAQFVQPNEAENGDTWFTYRDVLFVGINSNSTDYAAHAAYLKAAVAQAQRKWVVVLMHHSIFSQGEHAQDAEMAQMRKQYSAMFQEENVDLVLSGHDHSYSQSHLMQGESPVEVPLADGEKRAGETLYVAAGSASGNKYYDATDAQMTDTAVAYTQKAALATAVEVTEKKLSVRTYRIDTGLLVDEVVLQK